jgi:hypothetical protein
MSVAQGQINRVNRVENVENVENVDDLVIGLCGVI